MAIYAHRSFHGYPTKAHTKSNEKGRIHIDVLDGR